MFKSYGQHKKQSYKDYSNQLKWQSSDVVKTYYPNASQQLHKYIYDMKKVRRKAVDYCAKFGGKINTYIKINRPKYPFKSRYNNYKSAIQMKRKIRAVSKQLKKYSFMIHVLSYINNKTYYIYRLLVTTGNNSFIDNNNKVTTNDKDNTYQSIHEVLSYLRRYLYNHKGFNKVLVDNIHATVNGLKALILNPKCIHNHSHGLVMTDRKLSSKDISRLNQLVNNHSAIQINVSLTPFHLTDRLKSKQMTINKKTSDKDIKYYSTQLTRFLKYMGHQTNHQVNTVNHFNEWKEVSPDYRHSIDKAVYKSSRHVRMNYHAQFKREIKKIEFSVWLASVLNKFHQYHVVSQTSLFDPTKYERSVYSHPSTPIQHHYSSLDKMIYKTSWNMIDEWEKSTSNILRHIHAQSVKEIKVRLASILNKLHQYQVTSQSRLFNPSKYNRPVYSHLYQSIPHHNFRKSYHNVNLFNKSAIYGNKPVTHEQSSITKHAKALITVGTIRDEPILNVNGNSYLIRVSQYHIKSVKIQSDYIFNSS